MEDDGTPLDGRDEAKESQHGQVSVLCLGLGRRSRSISLGVMYPKVVAKRLLETSLSIGSLAFGS